LEKGAFVNKIYEKIEALEYKIGANRRTAAALPPDEAPTRCF
jgi:hypothetical protein